MSFQISPKGDLHPPATSWHLHRRMLTRPRCHASPRGSKQGTARWPVSQTVSVPTFPCKPGYLHVCKHLASSTSKSVRVILYCPSNEDRRLTLTKPPLRYLNNYAVGTQYQNVDDFQKSFRLSYLQLAPQRWLSGVSRDGPSRTSSGGMTGRP